MLPNVKRYLVTSALPYANGPIHIGHLVEYIQTDIWVRFKKLMGNDVVYICADDTHGTPIMLKAEKEGLDPEELINKVWKEHTSDFAAFSVDFDNYYSTHSEENRELSELIYKNLKKEGLISVKSIEQMFDEEKKMFLPDRFILGECPLCNSSDQYGDSCESCGATYTPTDLINPRSAVSGNTPIKKFSEHHFFNLSDEKCGSFLKQWTKFPSRLQPEVKNKIDEWLNDDDGKSKLSDWDISRDSPYFGFKIPDTEDKFFYVWLDAPVGYYASLLNWCSKTGKNFLDFTQPDSEIEQIHFIGKDILYFHSLFWPAMLHFAGFRTPTAIYAHGFLTINGQKMSKSRGTFITAKEFLSSKINPEFLRYYLASKLNGSTEDLDLNFSEFSQKINSELVGKYINILSRCSGFLMNIFNGNLIPTNELKMDCESAKQLEFAFENKHSLILDCYNKRNTNRAIREIIDLTDNVNSFIQNKKPWDLAKQISETNKMHLKVQLHLILSLAINYFAKLTILLKPIVPITCKVIEEEIFSLEEPWDMLDYDRLCIGKIRGFKHMLSRIKPEDLETLMKKR